MQTKTEVSPVESVNMNDEIPKTGFAISEYHDTGAVYEQLASLTSQPMRGLRRPALDEYLKYYETRCPSSKTMVDEAVNYIPGGVQHNLAFAYPFPLVFSEAHGAKLRDIDGNEYIDFLLP